ncbi:MAG: PAAR-like domain-containing protein, partial [Myxococcota bacterium]
MPVKAMAMTVVGEKAKHQVVPMSPCVCHTPAAPSPIPIPYPIFADAGSLTEKCDRIKIEGK